MFQPEDGPQDWAYGPGPESDHMFEKWLREQMRRRVEMEMRWEQEAAERDVREYRWMRNTAGGLISSIINCMFFIPLQVRRQGMHVFLACWRLEWRPLVFWIASSDCVNCLVIIPCWLLLPWLAVPSHRMPCGVHAMAVHADGVP